MSNPKKRTPIGVFEVLKSIMDAKVAPLREAVNTGNRAQTELPVLCERISNLQTFIRNSRYDPADVREAETEITEYEYQLHGIQKKIARGQSAEKDLVYADNFYASYADTCRQIRNMPMVDELRRQCRALEDKLSRLEDNMFACEINLDEAARSSAVVAQSRDDLDAYSREYQEQSAQLDLLRAQLASLQK